MASTIALRRRINSIGTTRQITKAMEVVSASKLRRAIVRAEASRPYRQAAYDLLARLNTIKEVEQQPLFRQRQVQSRLSIIITSNSGLAGAYNANVLKLFRQLSSQDLDHKIKSSVISIGSKGAQFVRRLNDVELLAHYPSFGNQPQQKDIQPILRSIIDQYNQELVDEVNIIYTVFRSSITQTATVMPLLPARLEATEANDSAKSFFINFEPDVETVIDHITTRLIEVQIWQALLESLASENAMRMLAMKNATDNANELIGDYTLEYNTVRQASITQELAEITGGAEAMKDQF